MFTFHISGELPQRFVSLLVHVLTTSFRALGTISDQMFLKNGCCCDDDDDNDDCTEPTFLSDSTETNAANFFCNFLRRKSVHLCVCARVGVGVHVCVYCTQERERVM